MDVRSYITQDDTVEDTHPCAFVSKLQVQHPDTTTYNDVLRSGIEEKKMWDNSMVKELTSLSDLGSLKMVQRPRGENLLQSTWVFKRIHYPDGGLRKYKA